MEIKQIKVTLSKDMLFGLCAQEINNNADVIKVEDLNDKSVFFGEEHKEWFLREVDFAEADIYNAISAILDKKQCKNDLLLITYTINIRHHFQLKAIADLIEAAILGLIVDRWFRHYSISFKSDTAERIIRLKSCVLKTEGSKGREFLLF